LNQEEARLKQSSLPQRALQIKSPRSLKIETHGRNLIRIRTYALVQKGNEGCDAPKESNGQNSQKQKGKTDQNKFWVSLKKFYHVT